MRNAAKTRDLQLLSVPGIPLIEPGIDLVSLICDITESQGPALREGDVLVLAQKIVSKAEGRYVDLAAITPSPRAQALARETDKDPRLVELILEESHRVVRHRPGVLIVEHRR